MEIDKITIAVGSMDAMVEFYTKTFGAVLEPAGPMRRGRMGSLQLLFCPKEVAGVTAEQNTIQLRFVVGDLNATVRRASESGGCEIGERKTLGTARLAAIRDPDGNSIELIET